MKFLWIVFVSSVLFLVGCGDGSGLPSSSVAAASLSPIQISVFPGETVPFSAAASGFTQPSFLSWWMQEQHDAGIEGSHNCDNITPANRELIPTCPFGYIVVDSMQQTSSTATYHAPQLTGTYHVTFRAAQMSTTVIGAVVEKRITATIRVE